MGDFLAPVDIWDAALAWCGANLSGDSLRNKATAAKRYDQVRKAELSQRTWTFATKDQCLRAIDINTMLLNPALWSQLTTYFYGSVVADQSGSLWISNIPNNLNNDPLLTNFWEPYFGPLSVTLYDPSISYFNGELVYTTPGDGTNRVYQSRIDGNKDVPGTATAYDPTVTYFKNHVVTFLSVAYMSLIDLNLNNEPDLVPLPWLVGTTYAITNKVAGSDGVIYQSVGSGNIGHDPTLDTGTNWTNTGVLAAWTRTFVGGSGSLNWLQIGGKEFPFGVGLTKLNVLYPASSGPWSQTSAKKIFLLPAGFLRRALQNQKAGVSWLGGPTGISYDDWIISGKYIVTSDTGPILLRFVVNITDVSLMKVTFCEGLALRLAVAICDTVTQDKGQFDLVAKAYARFENTALTIDGVEAGYVDEPDDDLITVRY
jgi:hypothetical protein